MKQIFIMLVGVSRSGKTHLANEIKLKIPSLIIIDSDSLLNFLSYTYPIFNEEHTINNDAYLLKQHANKEMQLALILTLLNNQFSILLDANNGRFNIRNKFFDEIKRTNLKIKTIIIRHKIDEKNLYSNIFKADIENNNNKWLDLYEKVQKPFFDEPKETESDYIFKHTSNTKEIIDKIKSIMN